MNPKLALINAGAVLAAAVVSNLPDDLVSDPEIVNDQTKAQDWMAYRLTQIFAIGLANALDPKNAGKWIWPEWLEKADESVLAGGPLGKLAELVLPTLASSQPALAALIQSLVSAKPAPKPSTSPVPDLPGTAK